MLDAEAHLYCVVHMLNDSKCVFPFQTIANDTPELFQHRGLCIYVAAPHCGNTDKAKY